ncbi:Guanine nucleotide-binding protein-like 3-like protein [Armadillidium vulgare]|nr:Guanine nucleotide-binding protein-like 3-like protein [Armadillidium vulgare]
MHKKSSKKKGNFTSGKTTNRLRRFMKQQTQNDELNEVIKVSQLFKSTPEERREKSNIEFKLRRKEEKLLKFDTNRKLNELFNSVTKIDKDSVKNIEEQYQNKFTDTSGKTYCKELRKVIEASDVILEVLDARDPEGSRSLPVEEMIMNEPNKRLILILNKADLVPKDCLDAWLKYFRSQHPTLLFKSSTQKQASNLSQAKIKNSKYNESFKTSKCVGASALMQLLKNYSRNCGIKTAISVGVVGLPNVGKSSLINSLRRMRACNVGATPGVTKTMQEVSLDSKIRIIDCPGVILPTKNESDAQASLRNAF